MKYTRGEWNVEVGQYPNSYFLLTVVEEAEGQANAKLIAAAPELLQSLQFAFDVLKFSGPFSKDDLNLIESAIKKATE